MTMTQNRPARPYSIRTWLIGCLGALALVGVAIGLVLLSNATAPKAGEDFKVTPGACTPAGTVGGQRDITVENRTGHDIRVKVGIEYRDGAGRLMDSDTADIEVPARETVLHREVTLFPGADAARSCPVTDVDASWS
jgi:hypothetical protein